MQVQAVNSRSNQTFTQTLGENKNKMAKGKEVSFGAIYQPKNVNFNNVQESISDVIKKAMREPLHKFNGKTAEKFYKSKGLDFILSPRTSESISLSAYRGLKETKTGIDKGCTFSDRIYIGDYDKNSEFRLSDIETSIKEKTRTDFSFLTVTLTAIFTILGAAITAPKRKIPETTKPLIENIDSITNKAKAVQPILEDSFKLGKNVRGK